MELKQNSNAIEMFDKVIKINQTFVDAYYNKGLCLSKLGRFEEAIFNYNFILSYDRKNLIKSSDISVYYNKAICLMKLERFTEAINMLNNVIEIKNNFYDAYSKRAMCLYLCEKFEESISDFDLYINYMEKHKHKKNLDFYVMRANCYLKIKKENEAIQNLDEFCLTTIKNKFI